MTPPSDSPAVVILDVMNLRGTEGRRKDAPFNIQFFDQFVAAIERVLPGAVILGIVDGTSAGKKDKKKIYDSEADRLELLRRTSLNKTHPQYLHLLPAPEKKWGWSRDFKYIGADPVCVHLLEKFSHNCALVTFDLIKKPEDIAYFPVTHRLRANVFRPFWFQSLNSWTFFSTTEMGRFEKWDKDFFDAVDNGEILRLEEFVSVAAPSEEQRIETRELAYGYVTDLVNEHRTAGNRTVPMVLEWQRSVGIKIKGYDPARFADEPIAVVESKEDELVDVPFSNDSDVLVRVETEEIDLIRSVDELHVHVGKRVFVHAMLRFVDGHHYLVWFGRTSRVRVLMEGSSDALTSGFVGIRGMLSNEDGELAITVRSNRDVKNVSLGDVVAARITRLVKRDTFVGGVEWVFPPLPPRPTRLIPPPPHVVKPEPRGDDVKIEEAAKSSDANQAALGHGDLNTEENKVRTTEVGIGNGDGGRVTGTLPPETEPEPTEEDEPNTRPSKRWIAVAIASLVVALALVYVLRTYVFAFEVPEPAVCKDLEPATCQSIVTEWQGDALRVNLYGTRGPDGLIR
jgi:hypothetical protein